MGDRLPTPEELWGPGYRERLQKQWDEYDAAVGREQAEIEARQAGKPFPPAGGVLEPAKQGEELQRVASFATQPSMASSLLIWEQVDITIII